MAVRDLFWGCPVCRSPGSIRRVRRRERCLHCDATFRRGPRACIVLEGKGGREVLPAAEWLARLGPPEIPPPDAGGRILGPEKVRVKQTVGQRPFYYGSGFMGWIETYGATTVGSLELHLDGLHFQATTGESSIWTLDELTGLQPASSTLQLGFRGHMKAVKFLEGPVRLWTRAIADILHAHYEARGRQVRELQPHVRTCAIAIARA